MPAKELKYEGVVDEEGKVTVLHGATFKEEIKREFAGEKIIFTVKKKRKKRSNPQNRYYFGVIVQICRYAILEHWGELYDTEQAHQLLKTNCNYKEKINETTGEVIRVPYSTSANDTFQQEEYHEYCRRFIFNNFNTLVPLPNEDLKLDLVTEISFMEDVKDKLREATEKERKKYIQNEN